MDRPRAIHRLASFLNHAILFSIAPAIAAEVSGIGDPPLLDDQGRQKKDRRGRLLFRSRKDRRPGGGHEVWLKLVDGQSLEILTPASIQKWRTAYLAKSGAAPDATRRMEVTAASLIRNARSLFSAKCREFAPAELLLPDPPPFAGVKPGNVMSTRYISRIDARSLINDARQELTGEPFKIFCLGLLCGLRKMEIDALLWEQVDLAAGVIRIEHTAFFTPKSHDSVGAVDVDPELVSLLAEWKKSATGAFVVESAYPPPYHLGAGRYRAKEHFKTLYAWLRTKGVSARKPLHEMRKELGALLASEHGIFAAQRVLLHVHIATTAAYYADKKKRITAGLGELLAATPKAKGPGTEQGDAESLEVGEIGTS